ncbi:MAG: 4Fe-4S dicluster domain-containing protein [Candidatus Omnitrophica bacterium]|nr:4Fe-4S dicluster domain-containing protein [Candidatus Omnitrophota bacterium]
MQETYYLETQKLAALISRLKEEFNVFVPALKDPDFTKEQDYSYACYADPESHFVFNPYRTVEPLKMFFTNPLEKVAGYFNPGNDAPAARKTIIFGVKSCDLAGHKVQDFVFLEGVEVDSLYRLRRENTIFISSDCTDFKSVCHCLDWEILPYPSAGFDLNLSPLNEGYVVEVGSNRGKELIKQYQIYFIPAKEAQLAARKVKRENLVGRLKKHLFPQNLVSRNIVQRLMKEGYNLDTWHDFMLSCVECGGCNFICDTCHCFLLADTAQDNHNRRLRLWDSCQYANYARVAGGANPLKARAQRLRFRFTKKFDFFIDNLGVPACCGCGRCIEVCPGKIDIREVLKDLAKKLNIRDE